jgi:hypothetical protein
MAHFQDSLGKIHCIDIDSTREPLPDWTLLTDAAADVILHPAPTQAEIIAALIAAVDEHINNTAKSKNYDSRITCALRAAYVNPWQTEGIAFGKWMDSCYAYCYQVMADVQAGTRSAPTEVELIAELPVMVWPV